MRKLLIFTLFTSLIVPCNIALSNPDSLKFTPKIEGCIRAKYEYNQSVEAHRFQVRNARFSIHGNFDPIVSYKAEIDLSDEGETKMLDAFIQYKPVCWWSFTIGQQKIPFSTDNLRSPHNFYFANRSFIGKQLCNGLRDVGGTLCFQSKIGVPVEFYTGVYNGDGLYNQQKWQRILNYAFRAVIFPLKNTNLALNFNSIQPENLRMNLYDASLFFNTKSWHIETEYLYKSYASNLFSPTNGFSVFACYNIYTPKSKTFQKISPLIRYDSMSDNNKGIISNNGIYITDDIGRARITGGITLCFSKPFSNEIRINYEQYFLNNLVLNTENKFVTEFVVRF